MMQPQKVVESGVQLFARINRKSDLDGLNPHIFMEGPKSNQIIEVVGDHAKDILVDFLIRCISPTEINSEWKSCRAIYINVDHHISIIQIANALNAHLKRLNTRHKQRIIEAALNNLIICNCYDAEQMQMAFRNLEKTVQKHDNISLIVVDNLSAQYWSNRWLNPKVTLANYTSQMYSFLYNLIKDFNIVLVFSHSLKISLNSLAASVSYKLITEQNDTNRFKLVVIDYEKETRKSIQFSLETCSIIFT